MSVKFQRNLLSILGIISILVSCYFLLSWDYMKEHYRVMFLLPAVYGVALFILSQCSTLNVFKTIAICTYCIKLMVTPWFITTIGERELQVGIHQSVYGHITEAVFLQILEIIAITITLVLLRNNSRRYNTPYLVAPPKSTWNLLKILCFIALALVIIYPQFLYKFQPIMVNDSDVMIMQKTLSSSVKDSMNLYVYHLGLWVVTLSKLLLVYVLIYMLYKTSNGVSRISLILSMGVVLVSCLFTTSDRAATIYTAIVGLLLTYKLYERYRNFIRISSIILSISGIFIIFLYNAILKADDSIAEIGYKLNAYFSGTLNVAACFEMDNFNAFYMFIGDILRNIPLIMGFFVRLPMSYLEFNKVLGFDDVYNSQILPVIGQGYFYFGILGSILFPILMIKVAYYFFNHIRYARDSFEYFAYLVAFIYTLLGINLYDMFLTMGLVLQYGFPMLMVCVYSYFRRR